LSSPSDGEDKDEVPLEEVPLDEVTEDSDLRVGCFAASLFFLSLGLVDKSGCLFLVL